MRRFLRATQYAAEHPDEAVDATRTYAPGADRGQQRFLLDADLAAAKRRDDIGRSSPQQWEALKAILRTHGVLTKPAIGETVFAGSTGDALYDAQGRLR